MKAAYSIELGQTNRSGGREMSGTKLFRRALGCGLLALGLTSSAHAQCQLNSPSGKIKHVVFVEFDNVHFTRDNPNVPSDLEQMPNLLNFIKQNGALDTGDHAVLISHTANDILTTQTGLYSDDHGIFISNNFGVFGPTGSGIFPSSFFYWTDLVSDINGTTADNSFALTTPSGQNVPAPWVPFTRAGCDVGAFSTANIVLERAPFDVKKVFGATSPQAAETPPNQNNDFIGAAIHCAIGSPLCTPQNNAVADLLPDEPGAYSGYQALFGLKYINPVLGGLIDYNGTAITGFNQLSFNPQPAQTLAVVETMLKTGIPVVFAYIADAHDNHQGTSLSTEKTFGPGEASYVKQLSDYNAAFGTFFANLKAAGIDQSNTLFIFTPDEGDHFSGAAPSPANCDGAKIVNGVVTPDIPCTYGVNGVGELDYDLNVAVANAGVSTPFTYHNDDAATVYVQGNPVPSSSAVRHLEKTMAGLNTVNPQTGVTESLLGTGLGVELQGAIVDKVGQKLLHMSSASDPNRDPTFTFFGDPNFFFTMTGTLSPIVGTGFAWNHGDIQPEIATTFIGMVGPGVRPIGVTQPTAFFTDHTDVRPTMMYLLGLNDDYQHDGRVILEMLDPNVLASTLHAHSHTLLELGQIYKQINAPFGSLAQSTLTVSTYAIESTSQGDTIYTNLENRIASWTAQRDALAAQMKQLLSQAQFSDLAINEQQAKHLISLSQTLLDQASACASSPAACAN
jgi:hypothetical protein